MESDGESEGDIEGDIGGADDFDDESDMDIGNKGNESMSQQSMEGEISHDEYSGESHQSTPTFII